MKRRLSKFLGLLMLAAAPFAAQAQADYPNRPVRVIVPATPGGALDVVARQLMQKLAEATGVQFIVENRAGGANLIGVQAAQRAALLNFIVIGAGPTGVEMAGTLAEIATAPAADLATLSVALRAIRTLVGQAGG